MSWFKSIVAASTMLFVSLSSADVGPWELAAQDEDKDIQIFTRTVEGSVLKEFKGVTRIKAPVSAFVALLKDSEAATEWMHNIAEYKVMETTEGGKIVYTVNNTPWPVTNRDNYSRSVTTADADGTVKTMITGVPDYQAVNEDYIRMPALNGSWTFSPKEEGMTEVTYQMHADPGGSLPTFLINAIVVKTPKNTLANLHDIVLEEKYQGQTFDFIEKAKIPAPQETAASQEPDAAQQEIASEQ